MAGARLGEHVSAYADSLGISTGAYMRAVLGFGDASQLAVALHTLGFSTRWLSAAATCGCRLRQRRFSARCLKNASQLACFSARNLNECISSEKQKKEYTESGRQSQADPSQLVALQSATLQT